MISPSSNSSSKLIQRSIVVFPEPDGPIRATVCPLGMVSDTWRSTSLEPNRFVSPRISISGAAGSGSALMDILHPFFEIATVRGEAEADAEIDQCHTGKDLEWRKGALDGFAPGHRQFPETNDRDQRRAFDQLHTGVDERRRSDAERLRDDYDLQGQRQAHPEPTRGIPFALRQ